MESTSVSLLRRLRQPADQEAAWKRFVDLYTPLIFQWGRNQGLNTADASDLVDEVLEILVVTKLSEFEEDRARGFRVWLTNVTVNKARGLHRGVSSQPVTGCDEAVELISVATDDVDLFDEVEYQGFLVKRAMKLMRAEFQELTWQACWRRIADGREASDVAKELGISINAVHDAEYKVMRRLREELDGLME